VILLIKDLQHVIKRDPFYILFFKVIYLLNKEINLKMKRDKGIGLEAALLK
jgi:hypothetical protein